jgi:Fe2+ or Zn2+ uptake regulation protein
MIIQCTHKGCYSLDNHELDLSTDQVVCLACGKDIVVPPTTKKTLQSFGQVKRKVNKGFTVACKACAHEDKPLLKTLSGATSIAVCRKCGGKLDIHPSFLLAMKEMTTQFTSESTSDEPSDG